MGWGDEFALAFTRTLRLVIKASWMSGFHERLGLTNGSRDNTNLTTTNQRNTNNMQIKKGGFIYLVFHSALHCVRFSGACLLVRKEGTIEAIEKFVDNQSNHLVVDGPFFVLWGRTSCEQDK